MRVDSPLLSLLPALTALILLTAAVAADDSPAPAPAITLGGEGARTQRIVVPGEKWPARWVRRVSAFDLLSAP